MSGVRDAEKTGRRRGMLLWSGNVVGLLLGYTFLYPVLFLYLDYTDWFDPPDWAYQVFEFSAWPLGEIYELSTRYEAYIDWLDDRIQS